MVIVVLVWGATFVVIKDALNDISPLLFNLLRMSLATATLALVYRRHLRSLSLRAWISGAVVEPASRWVTSSRLQDWR